VEPVVEKREVFAVLLLVRVPVWPLQAADLQKAIPTALVLKTRADKM
jgi:hypothetical protein